MIYLNIVKIETIIVTTAKAIITNAKKELDLFNFSIAIVFLLVSSHIGTLEAFSRVANVINSSSEYSSGRISINYNALTRLGNEGAGSK